MPSLKTRALIASIALAACDPTPPETPIADAAAPLLGQATYGADCSAGLRGMVDQGMTYGRTVAGSRAFEQCVDRAMRVGLVIGGFSVGPYMKCNGDPFYGEPLAIQLQRVLDAARSPNEIRANCTGGGGIASAGIGTYEHSGAETYSWSASLQGSYDQLGLPVCNGSNGPTCRWAPWPWPYSMIAGTAWHEAMHTHGYTHGANDQAAAKVNCGYGALSDAQWYYQRNTLPYIIGLCMEGLQVQSASVCAAAPACPAGQVNVVTGIGASTCECVGDATVVGGRTPVTFVHRANTAITTGNVTYLDHPSLNGKPGALPLLTHSFNPGGAGATYVSSPTGVWYNTGLGRWAVFTEDGTAMPANAAFNVSVGRGVAHRAAAGNTSGHKTYIDHALANGDAAAIVSVTQSYNPGGSGGTYNPHSIGVYYDAGVKKWAIFNQDFAAMPTGAGFHVDVELPAGAQAVFVARATAANTSGNVAYLSSRLTDGNPNVILTVTQNFSPGAVYNNRQIGVYYDNGRAKWAIYNEVPASGGGSAAVPMPSGAAFNVQVHRRLISRHVIVPGSATAVDTGIDLLTGDVISMHSAGKVTLLGRAPTGPEGAGTSPPTAPLPSAPAGALLVRGGTGAYSLASRDYGGIWLAAGGRLGLRTNDPSPSSSVGAYMTAVQIWR